MQIEWWVWIILAVFMFLAELITPGGFYLFFVGLAALIAGVLAVFIPSALVQILLFALLLTLLIIFFRKPLLKRVHASTASSDTPEFVEETATALEKIPAGKEGKVEMRGTPWQARNEGAADIPKNSQCIILSREGLLLTVSAKK